MKKCFYNPIGPDNRYSYFVGANPVTNINCRSVLPTIDSSVFIGPFSSIIGDVTICENVFIACNAVLRADEGTPFYIGCRSNIQDGVIFHGLKEKYVDVNNKNYSIYIGNEVTCAHSSIIHGPCYIGDETFVGVNVTIFNAYIEKRCYIGTGAIVSNGVILTESKFVPPGANIDTQEKANALGSVPQSSSDFAKQIVGLNIGYSKSYSLAFGDVKCSCGLCCNKSSLNNFSNRNHYKNRYGR